MFKNRRRHLSAILALHGLPHDNPHLSAEISYSVALQKKQKASKNVPQSQFTQRTSIILGISSTSSLIPNRLCWKCKLLSQFKFNRSRIHSKNVHHPRD